MKVKLLFIILLVLVAITMIANPKAVFDASLSGLDTWFSILVPSLLPFFIIANLLIKVGFVNFAGALFDPLMRPLFNVPGTGGFVMALGFTSGSPLGSLMSIELRKDNLCSKSEAERLMAFTNNSSPLFMFSAVSVGMFANPALGIVIALGHYLANLTIGIILGHISRINSSKGLQKKEPPFSVKVITAYKTMIYNSSLDLGNMLKEAINKSIQTTLAIGGFVLLFSVLIETFNIIGLSSHIYTFFAFLLKTINFDPKLASGLSVGFFEITLGIKEIVKIDAPLQQQITITAILLAWNGLSIHAQIASFTSGTDIQMKTYILSRIAHSFIGAFYTYLLWNPLYPVFSSANWVVETTTLSTLGFILLSSALFPLICVIMLSISLIIVIVKSILAAL